MKKLVLFMLCIVLIASGCSKSETTTYDNAEAYVVDFSDDMIVLHPKGTSPDTKIKIEIDTTSMDIVENDAFIIKGTATNNKMDKSCIVSQVFSADSIDAVEEVLHTQENFIVVNISRRNIKVCCDGYSFLKGEDVSVKGIAQKIEPESVYRSDGSVLTVMYEMTHPTVSKAPLITE